MDGSFVATILLQASSIATSLLHCSLYEMKTVVLLLIFLMCSCARPLEIANRLKTHVRTVFQYLLLIRVASYAIACVSAHGLLCAYSQQAHDIEYPCPRLLLCT